MNPNKNCPLCPRLVRFRTENQAAYPNFFNAPVPSFGPLSAKILVVGMAPGLKGANRTGRPFTGDYAGKLLYSALAKSGLTKGIYLEDVNDGLQLIDCRISNAVKCVPPQNKTMPEEERSCRSFLEQEIAAMENLKGFLLLGVTAHNAVLSALKVKKSDYKFGHGLIYNLNAEAESIKGRSFVVADSYHSSRYNVNTKLITQNMLDTVVKNLCASINYF